ncbi:MAG TPA: ribosome maturation factor RimM [Gemmatimonadales bacterium]|jgi:16S rRNA processing protein RimM|nr:ribosome maturation factor RimM [Gemmatimonadales bacterium]
MAAEEARHLVVGRLRKPHGLKGDCAVFPLTDEPAEVFAPGRSVWVKNLAGEVVAGPLTIERSRPYHREWLLAFRDHVRIEAVEPWKGHFLAAESGALRPPAEGEVYLHELAGFAVQDDSGTPLGLVSRVLELPSGLLLEVQGSKREFLVPFRKEFVVELNRPQRRMVVQLPKGLVEL